MANNEFKYILRYKIDPGYSAEERVDDLIQLCLNAKISEVMMFFAAEELSPGHIVIEELKPYIEMGKIIKDKLRSINVDLSLNPWTTTYHVSRGRKLREGQNFRLMVGETGIQSPITACPLCENWQRWLCDIFSYMAEQLNPIAIWIEDDWRLHNHEPNMGFGGCFCQLHLERFSKMVNQKVSREMVLEKILALGTPHPWRAKWLELSRESLIEPAVILRKAIEKVSPSTRLGLMSSTPDVHSTEGRNWHELQKAFGDDPAFMTRPHLPPYTETTAISTPPSITRQTIACLKRPIEVYPELENSPRNGVYSKSNAFSVWECMNAALYGSHGITINHFDMLGCGTSLDPNFVFALGNAKPMLNSLIKLGIDDINSQGVNVLFSPEIGKYIHSNNRDSLGGVCQDSTIWSKTLYTLGISHQFTSQIMPDISPYVVSGQTLRAFDDKAIQTLLSGSVILDAYSVEILKELGFLEHIGIKDCYWQTLEDKAYSYERIYENDPAIYGITNPRMTAQRCASKLLSIEVMKDTDVLSDICKFDHSPLFPGCLVYKNKLGGTVASLAYTFDGQAQFFMGYFNLFRRKFMQNLIISISPKAPVGFVTNHPSHVYRVQTKQGLLLAAFNIIADETDNLIFKVNGLNPNKLNFRILSDDGKWNKAELADIQYKDNYCELSISEKISYLKRIFILVSE